MPAGFLLAAAHPADTRLLIALVVFGVFVWVLPRPAPRPLAVAGLCAIVAIWDFGATLIWGTGSPSKLRFAIGLGTVGRSALLACAVFGIVAAGAALRSFADGDKRTGTILGGIFMVAFAAWSSAVRFSPIIAAIGLVTGGIALWWAAGMSVEDQPLLVGPSPTGQSRGARLRASLFLALPVLSGVSYYVWLRWGPKDSIDPACGATQALPAFIVSVGIPALAVGFTSYASGRRTEVAVAAAVVTTLLAAGICAVAFLFWFGQNHCGE